MKSQILMLALALVVVCMVACGDDDDDDDDDGKTCEEACGYYDDCFSAIDSTEREECVVECENRADDEDSLGSVVMFCYLRNDDSCSDMGACVQENY